MAKAQSDVRREREAPQLRQDDPPKEWPGVAKRVVGRIGEDNLIIVAAGSAFYAFLAIFPALASLVSIYGLVVDSASMEQQLNRMAQFLPAKTHELIGNILRHITSRPRESLGRGLAFSILLGLWSAKTGMSALFTGLNIAYDEREERGFIKRNALTVLFTFGAILFVIVSLVLVMVLPAAVGSLGLPGPWETVIRMARWPLLAAFVLVAVTVLYRYGPDRAPSTWRWVTWGSGSAVVLWLLGSLAFSFYMDHFAQYNKVYGSLAAVIILLIWLQLSSFVILLGAEINAEVERRSKKREFPR